MNYDQMQLAMAAKYSVQRNGSNPVKDTRVYLDKLITGRENAQCFIERNWTSGKWVYSEVVEKREYYGEVESRKFNKMTSKGRKTISKDIINEIQRKRLEGFSIREIAKLLKVGKGTVEKYMR